MCVCVCVCVCVSEQLLYLMQSFVSASLKTVVLPYLNIRLWEGFPLPLFHGYELENAEIVCDESKIMICSDVASTS